MNLHFETYGEIYIRIPLVPLCNLHPQIDRTILKLPKAPEQGFAYARIRMPVLVLPAWNCMQV